MPLGRTSWDHWSIATEAHDEPDPLTDTKLPAWAGMVGSMLPSTTAAPALGTAVARARHLGVMTSSSVPNGVVSYGPRRRRPGAAGAAWRPPRPGRRRPATTSRPGRRARRGSA